MAPWDRERVSLPVPTIILHRSGRRRKIQRPGRLGESPVRDLAEADRQAIAAVLDLDPIGRSRVDDPAAVHDVADRVVRAAGADEEGSTADLFGPAVVALDDEVHERFHFA